MATRVAQDELPELWPTHRLDAEFWEQLGRTVGTYGQLEDVLARAVYALTAHQPRNEVTDDMFEKWLQKLERTLSDTLNPLIDGFAKALREDDNRAFLDWEELIEKLRHAAVLRNALCHAAWQSGDSGEFGVPRYFDKKRGMLTSPFSADDLVKTREHVSELICNVIDSVTLKGIQFPGAILK